MIHLKRLLHDSAGAGEGGEDEDAGVVVVLARHELLGHEVHPVPQRSDQRHLMSSIQNAFHAFIRFFEN